MSESDTTPPAPSPVEPMRFELTAEQTVRFREWATAIQRAYRAEEVCGPAEITVSFRLTGLFGTEIIARCGPSELVLQALDL